jgi:signal transduction histidine kinase
MREPLRVRKASGMQGTPILIIDDEQAVLEGLREFLEDEGYEVHEAQDGNAGLAVFRTVKPDLVLTDLRMPGLSGIEVISKIRKEKENTAIIVFTGYGTLGSAIDAIQLQVFDFITKPIDLQYLKDSLDRARENLLATHRVREEMVFLREQLFSFQTQLRDQIERFSEVEPLIQTGRLLAGILHDLNNPLMSIMGQAEFLRILHPDLENVNVIQRQAQRMREIVSAIMQRIRSAQSRRLEWIQINKLLHEEVLFLECQPYFKHEVEKRWQLTEQLPLFRGIPLEMNQIFGNILRNAAEAMIDQPEKRLTIKSWHDGSAIHVSIRDTGPGIPWHLQDQIFQPFFTTKTATSSMMGSVGMGIGLFYCKELVRQYGGSIETISEPDAGANFIVSLPLAASYANGKGCETDQPS